MLFLEYQRNDIENCLVLILICPIRFNTLPGFISPFLLVDMEDFLQKGPFKNLQKRMKMRSKLLFVFRLSNNDTFMYSYVYPLEGMEFPEQVIPGGILSSILSFLQEDSTC